MDTIKLLAVDGLNLVRRVYEANPAPDSDAKAQGAVKSSFSSLKRALREHSPTHALLAFDAGGHTWRHDLYARYREGRKPMPEPLKQALPAFLDKLTTFGFCIRAVAGVEADDSLATVVTRANSIGATSVVLSTDKDLVSLYGPLVTIRDHFKPEWRDEAWALKKFGVVPALVADWLSLTGDDVDGIPGVEGIGSKTAARLLNEYGHLEAVLENADAVKGKVGESLRASVELARLSRRLVALKTDVELDIATWSQLRCPDMDSLASAEVV